jgi:hydrogenase maturation protease
LNAVAVGGTVRPDLRAPLRVLALGSQHGDDRAGWEVAERLHGDPSLDVRVCADPGSDVLAALEGATRVVFVDAVVDGGAPGRVVAGGRADLDASGARWSSHGMALATMLDLADALHLTPDELSWVGVTIDPPTEPGAALSAPVRDALPALCEAVRAAAQGRRPPFLP